MFLVALKGCHINILYDIDILVCYADGIVYFTCCNLLVCVLIFGLNVIWGG